VAGNVRTRYECRRRRAETPRRRLAAMA